MSIILRGPPWPSVTLLRTKLAALPGTGTFTLGRRRILATEQLRLFHEAGLRTPEFTTSRTEATEWLRDPHLIVLGRLQSHSKGLDIMAVGNGINLTYIRTPRWRSREWFCKFIPNVRSEWRLHIFDTKCIARGVKIQTNTTGRPRPDGLPIRNRTWGWTMDHRSTPPRGLRDIARRAVDSLGWNYGAVDMLVMTDGPRVRPEDVVVCEVNSIAGLDNSSADAYARAIHRHVTT